MFQQPRARRIRVLAAAGAAILSVTLLASPALATTTAPGPVADDQPPVISVPHPLTPDTSPAGTSTDSETTASAPETSAPATDATETSAPPTDGTTTDFPTSSTSAPTTAPPGPPDPDIPTITWTPCRGAFQCARTTAPLDYDRPFATTISLNLIRLPAADPAQRIGSLFVNPGGPGGSGVDFVRQAGRSLPLELRGRFDIIGFDPRGIAESTPLRCFATFQEAVAVLPPFAFPVTESEQAQWRTGDQALSAACADRGGAIQNHMSTANVARDLDLLRQAVGDDKLNFLGYSYGSYIGTTYANLFPDRVGALVVDGVLNPVAWSTGTDDESATLPFTSRLGSDAGASSTLGEFFRLCDAAGTDCALAPNAEARYAALAQDALDGGIEVTDEFGTFTVTYADLIGTTLGVLYAPEVWPDFAPALASLEPGSAGARQRLSDLAGALGAGTAAQEEYPNFVESFAGVACGETDNPLRFEAWPAAAEAADEQTGYFGRPWTWSSSVCQQWPGRTRTAMPDRGPQQPPTRCW